MTPDPKANAASASGAPSAAADASEYKVGDRLNVSWHGDVYPATITKVLPGPLYGITYVGYGHDWDEVIKPTRIVGGKKK
jgi:hypothetical protein